MVGLVVGLAALAGAAVTFAGERAYFFRGYLLGLVFWTGVSLGCLALSMVHHLSGGAWGVVSRRVFEGASRMLPLMAVLFVPFAFGLPDVYLWARPEAVHADPLLQHKATYLNVGFFLIRASIYFLAWSVLALMLSRWSHQQEHGDPDDRLSLRMQRVSGGGIVLYALTVFFMSVDWMMSLDPHWFSTIYGVLIMGGQGLSSLAFLIIVLVWLSRRPPLDRIVVPAHFHDLGNLMLAFVMLWAYFSFSQYLIIWSGNLPAEIGWYLHRLQTGWRAVGLVLILFHFAAPFIVLLSRKVKRQPELLVKVAIGILVVRLIDLFWLIAPEFHQRGVSVSWLDVVLPLTLGSIWLGCFVWQLRGRAILPLHDPEFDEALGRIIERGTPPRTAH